MADYPHPLNILWNVVNVPLSLSEFVALISSEMIVRLILKENAQIKSQTPQLSDNRVDNHHELKARMLQLMVLVILSGVYQVFLHLPLLLILWFIAVTMRLFILKCCSSRNLKNASKRLRYNTTQSTSAAPLPSISTGSVAYSTSSRTNTTTDPFAQPSNEHFIRQRPAARTVPVIPLNDTMATSTIHSTTTPLRIFKTRSPVSHGNTRSPLTLGYGRPITRSQAYLASLSASSSTVGGASSTTSSRSSPTGTTSHSFSPTSTKPNILSSPTGTNAHHKLSPAGTDQSPVSHLRLSPPGIANTGNICFLSSSIQCLATVDGFYSLLRVPSSDKRRSLVQSLHHLLNQMQAWRHMFIVPSDFLQSVSHLSPHLVAPKKRGSYQNQQDAGEFILWLLDNLHMALKDDDADSADSDQESVRSKEEKLKQLISTKDELMDQIKDISSSQLSTCYDLFRSISTIDREVQSIRDMSTVYQLFCGQVLEARECQECKRMSINLEYHTILPLSVPHSSVPLSIMDCFTQFGEVENLSNEHNMLLCSYCSSNSTTNDGTLTLGKRLALFSSLPNRLIIQLMRYSYDSVRSIAFKERSPIYFPVTDLDLTNFTMEAKLGSNTHQLQTLYNLTGFCVHTGAQSTSNGHYVAYTKVKDGSWYQFNDEHVTLVNDIGSEIFSPFVSQNAYILFYTQQTND